MDELLRDWRDCYDSMMEDTAELRGQFEVIHAAQREIEAPYEDRMKELEVQIRADTIVRGMSHSAEGVLVSYRKGYERVSYDSDKTDAVLGVLRDVLPETAKTMEGARKVSHVSPSVTVKAV